MMRVRVRKVKIRVPKRTSAPTLARRVRGIRPGQLALTLRAVLRIMQPFVCVPEWHIRHRLRPLLESTRMRQLLPFSVLPRSRSARILSLTCMLALAVTAASCKKGGDAVEPVVGKKPPIVKAKKPGKDVETAKDDKAAPAPAAATPTTAPAVAAVRPPEPATPVAAPIVPKPKDAAKAPEPAPLPPAALKPPEPPKVADALKAPEPQKPQDAIKPLPRPEPPKPAAKDDDAPVPPGGAVVRATPSEPPLDLTGYLSIADLEKVLGAKQHFRRADLPGVPPSPGYNAILFASDKPNELGVTVQVWRDPNLAESRTRYNTMKNAYSNVTSSNKVTDMGFRAWYGPVVTQVFVDPRRPLLAAISCSGKVCNGEQLIELARRVAERLR